MPNQLEKELGIDPIMHRIRRWLRNLFARLRLGAVEEDRRTLDPLTVNYEAWRAVRRNIREWPNYREVPNDVEVLVSPEDWDDYWGVDAARKEAAVASYVTVRAGEKGLWISGRPQVHVMSDDDVKVGEVEVRCQFIEPVSEEGRSSLGGTTAFEPLRLDSGQGNDQLGETNSLRKTGYVGQSTVPPFLANREQPGEEDTLRFLDDSPESEACLVGEGAFRLVVHSGDCIGAVSEGDEVSDVVNVRLDAADFPYVEPFQCSLDIIGGRWCLTNHAAHGTRLDTHDGNRYMLSEGDPFPLSDGDVLWLGPSHPLRFEMILQ